MRAVLHRAYGEGGGVVMARRHWPDCAVNHGGSECDMGPECGDVTADDITDDEIRELLAYPHNDLDFDAACRTALGGMTWGGWTREAARARCADVLNARRSR